MKICIYSISPQYGGGVVTKTLLLIKYFKSCGYTVDWYFPKKKGELPKYVKIFCELNTIKMTGIMSIPYLRFLDGLDIFNQIPKNYDIYQVISGFCSDGLVFRNHKNKYFIWAASTYKSEKFNYKKLKLYRPKEFINKLNIFCGMFLEKKYAKNSFKIFSNSNVTKNKIISDLSLKDKKIRVAYPIIDLDRYHFKSTYEKRINGGYILFVGIFSDRKNIELLLQAFKIIQSKKTDLKLKLVGNTNGQKSKYHSLVEYYGIEEKVEIIGEVEDVHQYFSNALVTVLPSNEEGFGMVLAESLACGTPVVSTKSGGVTEIVDHNLNGFLVDSDPQEMADRVLQIILDKKLMNRFSINGFEKVRNTFSSSKVGEIFIYEYKKYLKSVYD